jgi:long-subunit fatty acid transport protein
LLATREASLWAACLTLFVTVSLVGAGSILLPAPASAQNINDAVTIEDLGFTQRLAVGARPAGMAGAYVAAGNDVHSLIYNPAGLARIRRIDLSVGFQYAKNNVNNVFYGTNSETDFSSTTLDAVAIAYPIPTYRGSLVVAGGVWRVMSSQFDILNRGFNTDTDTFDDYLLQQSGSAYSYNLGFGIDLAPELSVGMNGFILHGTINALTQFSYRYPPPLQDGEVETATLIDDAEVDLDGYGLTLGLQYHPHRLLHFGLAVTTPTSINLRGDAATEEAWYRVNAADSFAVDQFVIETDYTIPFRIDAGVSFTLPQLLLSLDADYSDWTQAEVNNVRLKDENLNSVFREVVDIRIGGEYLVPGTPLRLRAGYAFTPFALDDLQADRIEGNAIQKAHVDTERQTLAAGFGVLLNRVLTIDASFEQQTGKRSIATLTDERTTQRVVLTGSYRF